MGSMIRGLHHVALKCRDAAEFEKVIAFYHETLGFPAARRWPGGAMLDTGSGMMEIFAEGGSGPAEGSIHHFAFAAADTDACIKAVRVAGYEVLIEPKEISIPSEPPYPARIAFCTGPLGETIEFFQER